MPAIVPGSASGYFRPAAQSTATGSSSRIVSPPPVSPPADAYGQAVYADGPVAWYRLDGDTTDYMGGAPGALPNGATYGAAVTPTGQAISLNGTNQYITVPDQPKLRLSNPLTLEAWVVPSSTTSGFYFVVGTGAWMIERHGANWDADQDNTASTTGTATVTAGNAYHLVAVWSGGNMALYVNGQLDVNVAQANPSVSTDGLYIGSFFGSSEFWDGRIDDVAVYNRALSQVEVQAHYAAGTNASSPVPLTDAASGTDAVTVTTGVPTADTGAAADAVAVTASVPITDTGTGTDTASVAAAAPLTDAGAATDAITVTVRVPLPDTATGADGIAIPGAGNIPLTDTGTSAETITATARTPLSDSATAADALTTSARVGIADTGIATDALTVTVRVPLVDTSTTVDSLAVGAPDYTPHVYVTVTLTSDGTSTAALADNGVSAVVVGPLGQATAVVLPVAPADAALATDGTSTAALATDGTSTATLAEVPATAELQLT